ncbi:MAG: histidine phosphatase family protein [Anaerolineae bacterium]
MKRLILVRHGETEWNRTGRYQGFAVTPLNERGRWQAERVARRLAGWEIDAIYASDLPRAFQTAEPIARRLGLPINTTVALREVDVGEWEGLTVPEIQVEHAENWDACLVDPIGARRKGGESFAELADRVEKAFQQWQVLHAGEIVLAVTHGGPIQVLVCTILGLPLRFRRRLRIGNTSITTLAHHDGQWYLETLNDTAHLEDIETPGTESAIENTTTP